jgi:hypothetical protein
VSPRAERWLFAPADPQSAALLRIAFAAFVPWCFAMEGLRLTLPAAARALEPLYPALFLTRGWWAAILAACALLALGVRPRASAAALFALCLPLAFVLQGEKSRHVLLVALAAFAFVKSDARLAPFARGPRRAHAGPLWPIRLIQLDLCVLYGVNALAKAHPAYLRGDVLTGFSITRRNILVDLSDGFLHLGPLALPVWLLAAGTVATEAWLAVGWWLPRMRWPTAALGIAFHTGLRWVVAIHMLGATSVFLYLAFLLPFERGAYQASRGGRSSATSAS